MSYEQMRSSLSSRLLDHDFPVKLIHDVLQELDMVASDYDIKRACTDLITADGSKEMIKYYCAALAVERKAMGTIKGYRQELERFFDTVHKSYEKVTANDVRNYLFRRTMESNLKKSSEEHIRVILNAFFNWIVDQGIMDRNPVRNIDPIKYDKSGRDPIPPIELEWLRLSCLTSREKALIDFLYSTGCRVSECAALNVADIDWRDRSVRIRHGKGDKPRIVCFNAESEVSLRKYLDEKKHPSSALFSKSRAPYDHVSREILEAEVRKVRSRVANLSVEVVPHALRTTFGTDCAAKGMPVQHVQMLMGHKNINTTMRYVHSSQEDAFSSHRKYMT